MIIHIITPITATSVRDLEDVASFAGPDLQFRHSLLDKGPPSIESEFDEAFALPDTIIKAIEAERAGADAIIIDCLADPGVKAVREVVSIPVMGPGESSMHLAAMLAHKFSIVTVLDAVKPMLADRARVYGVSEKLASIRVVDIPVLELEERMAEVQQKLAEVAQIAIEQDGADAIILGCTGFLGCAEAITKHLLAAGHDVPVIDPIPATLCLTEGVVKAGLRPSKRTYMQPRPKVMPGYDLP